MISDYGWIDGVLILPIGGGEGEPEPKFIDSIPEVYRETPWAKENSESPEAFYKFVDNQNKLVGAKGPVIPGDNASQEVIDKYQIESGRPEKSEGYLFTSIDAMKDAERNVEMDKSVQGILFKHGVSKVAGEGIVKEYEGLLHAKAEEGRKAEEVQDKAFAEFNTKLFGDSKDTIVANAQKLIRETLPKEALPIFDKMDAETISTVIAAVDGVYKKYGKEDDFKGGGKGPGTGTAETFDELSAKQRELMKNEAFTDWRHADHGKIQAQNKEIMDKMRAVSK